MQFRRRPGPVARQPDLPPPAARSAAWLAGERLFEAPPPPDEPAAPVAVTVRRSKLAVPAPAGEGAATEGPEAAGAEWKGPRVFRLEAASNETVVEPEPPAPQAAPAPVSRPSRRRIGVDRRPGPVVVQVFQAEPAAAEAAAPPFHEQRAVLGALMAEVSGILAEAQRASALRFVDAN